jgi:DNA-binding transcriptional ArsR family regulator
LSPKRPPSLSHPQLLAALSHPTRAYLLSVLNERTETPKNLAEGLGCPIRHVAYHLKTLEELGCIELVKTERSAGGRVIGHFYRATERLWFDRKAWAAVEASEQPGITMTLLGLMSEDITKSLLAGMIDEGENHISRTPAVLDEIGYEQLLEALNDALERVIEIQAESANRLEQGGRQILTKVHLVQFVSPDPT